MPEIVYITSLLASAYSQIFSCCIVFNVPICFTYFINFSVAIIIYRLHVAIMYNYPTEYMYVYVKV